MTGTRVSPPFRNYIPSKFRRLLEKHPDLENATIRALIDFSACVSAGPLKFDVLHTAAELIEESAFQYMTSQDVAAFTIATLLHDIGMHLQPDGFAALVTEKSKCTPVPGFDDKPWSQLWTDFLEDVGHFDYRKNTALFGDPTPISKPTL